MKHLIYIVLGIFTVAALVIFFYTHRTYDESSVGVEEFFEEKIEKIEEKQEDLKAKVPVLKDLIVREAYTYKQNTDKITHLLDAPIGDTITYEREVKDSVRAFLSHTLKK